MLLNTTVDWMCYRVIELNWIESLSLTSVYSFLCDLCEKQGLKFDYNEDIQRLPVPLQDTMSDCGTCMLLCLQKTLQVRINQSINQSVVDWLNKYVNDVVGHVCCHKILVYGNTLYTCNFYVLYLSVIILRCIDFLSTTSCEWTTKSTLYLLLKLPFYCESISVHLPPAPQYHHLTQVFI